jgi:co-chaperonin GroES (HSP10)
MFKKVVPVNGYILVQLLPKKQHVAGELYIPDNTPANLQTAKVISVGDSKVVNPGDVIAFLKHNATILDDEYQAVHDKAIFGVVHE